MVKKNKKKTWYDSSWLVPLENVVQLVAFDFDLHDVHVKS